MCCRYIVMTPNALSVWKKPLLHWRRTYLSNFASPWWPLPIAQVWAASTVLYSDYIWLRIEVPSELYTHWTDGVLFQLDFVSLFRKIPLYLSSVVWYDLDAARRLEWNWKRQSPVLSMGPYWMCLLILADYARYIKSEKYWPFFIDLRLLT